MDNEEIKLLLVKYITREADEQETDRVREWVKSHPENEQYFAQLYETWQNMLYLKPGIVDEEKAYQKFLPTIPKETKYRQLYKWSKVAAIVALFSVLSVLLIKHYSKNVQSIRLVSVNNGGIKKIILILRKISVKWV